MFKAAAKVRPWRFERRLVTLSSVLALMALVLGVCLLCILPITPVVRGILIAALAIGLCILLVTLFNSVVEPLRGLTSVVESYREGDYTIRSSRAFAGDALGDLVREVNTLGDTLLAQRLRAMEATALLDKLINAIDIAVLAFDGEGQLRLFNSAALQLLDLEAEAAAGKAAGELGVADLLSTDVTTHIATAICGRVGRWQVTHGTFRDEGFSQHLLLISDVRRVLREEEHSAWQRLIRVFGHEINNSLAPIKSIAETLHEMLVETLPTTQVRADALPALRVIADRTATLQRFLAQYSRLARLPSPQRHRIRLAPLLKRVAALEPQHGISIVVPETLEVYADETQLEQALINLVRNAVEAHGETTARIAITAQARNTTLRIMITDEGPGIANFDNLFVPFFTTKPNGSGIGLLLSRQIAEAHGGTLSLGNRHDARGAIATLELPEAVRQGS